MRDPVARAPGVHTLQEQGGGVTGRTRERGDPGKRVLRRSSSIGGKQLNERYGQGQELGTLATRCPAGESEADDVEAIEARLGSEWELVHQLAGRLVRIDRAFVRSGLGGVV
ncbi:hypothetical protein ONZ51_g6389 [Trametes cubensis]|uniref:Uncharacterized protein n=1 Tax=Trametes cubensis TaxID=1111947 RepID=A0AAD7TUL7_9APHY|nr:hypothetical protein ONZ51_g6389 [Trametes cubensis]